MTTPATEEKRKKFELINMFVTTISVIVMGSINIYVTYSQNNDRLEFDRQNAQSILSMQNKELFSKDTEAVKQSELDFLKMGYEECQKDGELSFKRIQAYADVMFTIAEKRDMMVARVRGACSVNVKTTTRDNSASPVNNAESYRKSGVAFLQNKQFTEAADAFINATQMTPVDASLWNQRAYAQYRSGSYADAMNSISVAIRIGSNEERVNNLMAINAAKILCAQGRINDGNNYIKQAINAMPGLIATAQKDGELITVCQLSLLK
ncbi:tetratricopeptide repeat protein [Trabulsiella odontotermitis]|uniref:Uncharacterized protein n=1 Tax=Trabulsiella odontotermitis TaxID=379893 RepID=A0A0L0GHF9_9ENTR|nr:tetratricopeptide repeat protein [Trabulsiella odontotermitis]KNC88256.1 hypothetical protein GM31_11065 [Trabulsiella odontotermitis]